MKNLLIRGSVESAVHGSDAANETHAHDEPRVHSHKTIRPATHVEGASSNTNYTDTKTSVHKSLIQEAPLVSGHTAILSRFAVEDEVGCQNCTTNNGSAIYQFLGQVTILSRVDTLLHVCTTEGILEVLARLGEDRGNALRLCCLGWLDGRIVNESGGVCELRDLAKCRGYSERAP